MEIGERRGERRKGETEREKREGMRQLSRPTFLNVPTSLTSVSVPGPTLGNDNQYVKPLPFTLRLRFVHT